MQSDTGNTAVHWNASPGVSAANSRAQMWLGAVRITYCDLRGPWDRSFRLYFLFHKSWRPAPQLKCMDHLCQSTSRGDAAQATTHEGKWWLGRRQVKRTWIGREDKTAARERHFKRKLQQRRGTCFSFNYRRSEKSSSANDSCSHRKVFVFLINLCHEDPTMNQNSFFFVNLPVLYTKVSTKKWKLIICRGAAIFSEL